MSAVTRKCVLHTCSLAWQLGMALDACAAVSTGCPGLAPLCCHSEMPTPQVTAGLCSLQLGVELDDKGGVKVDDYSQSSVPSIFAIGDVSNRIPLTPVARMEGTYFARHLYG